VAVAVGVRVAVPVVVGVAVTVLVAVGDGVLVAVAVCVSVGVAVRVGVGVRVDVEVGVGVFVGVGVGEAAFRSNAPMSRPAPAGRRYPRWSVVTGVGVLGPGVGVPAPGGQRSTALRTTWSTAGLSAGNECVCVGPPFSPSAPSRGGVLIRSLSGVEAAKHVPSLLMLSPSDVMAVGPAQLLPFELFAMIVLRSVTTPVLKHMSPLGSTPPE
jgi:hypothetical protein